MVAARGSRQENFAAGINRGRSRSIWNQHFPRDRSAMPEDSPKSDAFTTSKQGRADVGPITETSGEAIDADGLDRRNFLSCMAWVGTGLLWTVNGGVPRSSRLGAEPPGKG